MRHKIVSSLFSVEIRNKIIKKKKEIKFINNNKLNFSFNNALKERKLFKGLC